MKNRFMSHRSLGSLSVVALLSLCVFAQMLGMPVTMLGLVTSSDMLMESVSEDFSLAPDVLELGTSGLSHVRVEFQTAFHLPVLVTSVFHPPQS